MRARIPIDRLPEEVGLRRRFLVLWVALLVGQPGGALVSPESAGPGEATIWVDASKKATFQIPRTIYGTFLEPIRNSIYGGLWAQILENPSFEDNLWSAGTIRRMIEREPTLEQASSIGLPLPWEPLDASQGSRYEPRWGDAANSSCSLLVMALPGKQTGIRQKVYLPVHRVSRYTGSLYGKHVSGPREIEVSLRLRNHPDTMLATAPVRLAGGDWARYQFTLEVPHGRLAQVEPADFVVALADEGRALIDQVFLFPADHVEGMDPEMIAMAKALKTPVVRYGGNFTSGYHWRDGTGLIDKRVSMLNQAWGMPEYNHFGTDEFLHFCELIGAEPQIALNLGSGTPEEAADWVRYVDSKWGDQRGGLLWELGNELWGDFQIGYPTLERVAQRTKAFSDAASAVDPRARLIATGQDPDHFREWNAAQLGLPPHTFQYLSTHFVVGTGDVRRKDPTPDFIAESALALPIGLERALLQMKAQIDEKTAASGRVKIAFTEWVFDWWDDGAPRWANMGGALCAAGFLNTLIRLADFTPVSNMTCLIEFGGISKKRGRVYGVPAYWAFRMYSTSGAAVPVESRVQVESYDIRDGNRRIPEITGVPYLDVVAALNEEGDKLMLFCVNRHLDRDIEARILLAGFAPATEARVLTLAAASIHEVNDEMRPEAVRPVESTVSVSSPEFRYAFRRSSVTLVEMRRQESAGTRRIPKSRL